MSSTDNRVLVALIIYVYIKLYAFKSRSEVTYTKIKLVYFLSLREDTYSHINFQLLGIKLIHFKDIYRISIRLQDSRKMFCFQ